MTVTDELQYCNHAVRRNYLVSDEAHHVAFGRSDFMDGYNTPDSTVKGRK